MAEPEIAEPEKKVQIGSRVTVEVYLGRARTEREPHTRKFFVWERFRGEEYKETYTIGGYQISSKNPWEISCDSFIGRALLGAVVGEERIANVGGVSLNELRVGVLSGNHIKFKILAIS